LKTSSCILYIFVLIFSVILGNCKSGTNAPIHSIMANNINNMNNSDTSRLESARKAALKFCKKFNFEKKDLDELQGPPLDGPVMFERMGDPVVVYRWLGSGRGGRYVQPEIDIKSGKITVYGGYSHYEFGPWNPDSNGG